MTTLAGFVDAVGYGHLNHLYLSFMSGNSTHFGMALGTSDWNDAGLAAMIIAAFVAGAAIGTEIADAANRLVIASMLGGEFVLSLWAIALAIAGHDHVALALLAVAMGMQNTLHMTVAGADVGKGFITGALFALGQSLARLLRGREQIAMAMSNALSWLVFVGGAILGTVVLATIGLVASLGVIAAVLAISALTAYAGWL